MLRIRKLNVFRGETQVLWDIDLEIERGERVAILGSNGAGKTSLLHTVTGLQAASSGEILFNGEPLTGIPPHLVTRKGIAMVPEGRRVYRDMTVQENLEIGGYSARGRNPLPESLQYVFMLFPALEGRKKQRAGTLSGGEQQMLAIGRALMSRPELLLIDELSLGLAPVVTKDIYRTMDGLGKDTTILLVEQNVEQALRHSGRAYVLESGRLTRSDRSETLLKDRDIRRAYLGI